jgi:hypothetical protein
MDINRYKKISKNKTRVRFDIDAHIPVPTERDYNRGFIKRYFIQKTNDKGSPIYEVTKVNYGKYKKKPYYVGVSLRWRVTGPTEQRYDSTGNVIDKAVSESNRIAISLCSYDIPNLKLYLPNLLQFYKK